LLFNAASQTVSVSVTVTMLDRLFNILYPVRYKTYHRTFVAIAFSACFSGFFMCCVTLYVTEWPLDEKNAESKLFFGDRAGFLGVLYLFNSASVLDPGNTYN
jgi:hypothetical protein